MEFLGFFNSNLLLKEKSFCKEPWASSQQYEAKHFIHHRKKVTYILDGLRRSKLPANEFVLWWTVMCFRPLAFRCPDRDRFLFIISALFSLTPQPVITHSLSHCRFPTALQNKHVSTTLMYTAHVNKCTTWGPMWLIFSWSF